MFTKYRARLQMRRPLAPVYLALWTKQFAPFNCELGRDIVDLPAGLAAEPYAGPQAGP